MKKTLKIIYRVISTIIMVAMIAFIVARVYTAIVGKVTKNPQPDIFGVSSAVIITASMSGTLEIDDYIIVVAQDDYVVGDIISYRGITSSVTHRIIEITDEGYITQGDANNADDGHPIPRDRVIGKVMWYIPQLGATMRFFNSPLGMCILVFALFALIELPVILGKGSKKIPATDNKEEKNTTPTNDEVEKEPEE